MGEGVTLDDWNVMFTFDDGVKQGSFLSLRWVRLEIRVGVPSPSIVSIARDLLTIRVAKDSTIALTCKGGIDDIIVAMYVCV